MWCVWYFAVCLQKQSLGSTLLDEVFRELDLLEKDFFGLAYGNKGLGMVSVAMRYAVYNVLFSLF